LIQKEEPFFSVKEGIICDEIQEARNQGHLEKFPIPPLQAAGKSVPATLLALRDPQDSGFFEVPLGIFICL